MTMSDITAAPLRIALVGTGGWSAQHARYLAGRADVDFRAIVGRTHDTAKARAERFGTRFYLNVEEMLEREQPDLVVLSLPNQHHYEPTLKVIQAGFPLVVEKPLTFTLVEAETLLAEAAARDLFFAIDFNHRYAKPFQLARAAIDAGQLGDMVFATWRFGGEGSSDHPHANLIETQCHGFDALEYFCGPIRSVMAEMTDFPDRGHSTIVLSLAFASGALGSLVGSYDSSYAYRDTHRMELNGTAGRVLIDDTVRSYRYHAAGSETAEVWEAGYFNDIDREFHRTLDRHMDVVLAAIRAGEQPPVHARAGLRALHLAHAAIASFETGRRVTVEPPG